MARSDIESSRPPLVSPRQLATLDAVRTVSGGGFDPDAWVVMERRDDALIADEILHGAGSSTFVYSFPINGVDVAGISVIGARHLANHYKGLKHRLVAAQQKTGSLFVFTSYPAENMPMSVSASVVSELADEDDFYAAVVEVTDIKTGNSIQIERREPRYEERRGGGWFERAHYATIAQSKAYRNAVLALVPQDIAIRWKLDMLRLKKEEVITDSVIDQKRANVLQFAAQKAIALDRQAIQGLTLDQIAGLGDAAREGRLPAFVEAAKALGLEIAQGQAADAPKPTAASPPAATERRGGRRAADTVPRQTPPQTDPAAATNETAKSDAPPAGEDPAAGGQQSSTGATARRSVNFEM
jgi:hypothetical protein